MSIRIREKEKERERGNTQKQARQLRNKQRIFEHEKCQTVREIEGEENKRERESERKKTVNRSMDKRERKDIE